MKYLSVFAVFVFAGLVFAETAFSADLNGLWTKTTDTDPDNITIIYREGNEIKAIGFSEIGDINAIWFAAGEIDGDSIRLDYRYSKQPEGWEPAGTMTLTVSDGGNTLSGKAESTSGNWSGPIAFKRIR